MVLIGGITTVGRAGGYGRSNVMSQNVVQNIPADSDQISETIALGKISIKANVTVTFELKK